MRRLFVAALASVSVVCLAPLAAHGVETPSSKRDYRNVAVEAKGYCTPMVAMAALDMGPGLGTAVRTKVTIDDGVADLAFPSWTVSPGWAPSAYEDFAWERPYAFATPGGIDTSAVLHSSDGTETCALSVGRGKHWIGARVGQVGLLIDTRRKPQVVMFVYGAKRGRTYQLSLHVYVGADVTFRLRGTAHRSGTVGWSWNRQLPPYFASRMQSVTFDADLPGKPLGEVEIRSNFGPF